jgi:hypothetical protein
LPRIAGLQRFAFVNQNGVGQGDLELAVSNYRLKLNDTHWRIVEPALQFNGKQLLSLPLLGVEAKYVKLSFHVHKAGRLAGVALYGTPTLENFADRHILRAQTNYTFSAMKVATRLEDTLSFNFANEYARGRVIYVSSGNAALAGRMIDDDASTSFSFAAEDPHPTVIIALAHRQNLHRVSAIYEMKQGQVEVYLLDHLGSTPGDLSSAELIATSDRRADGKAAAEFDPRGARYVALRWIAKQPQREPVNVAELGVFGTQALSVLDLEEVPNAFAETAKPGEGGHDFSNGLGTLAAPPILEPVSP